MFVWIVVVIKQLQVQNLLLDWRKLNLDLYLAEETTVRSVSQQRHIHVPKWNDSVLNIRWILSKTLEMSRINSFCGDGAVQDRDGQ